MSPLLSPVMQCAYSFIFQIKFILENIEGMPEGLSNFQ